MSGLLTLFTGHLSVRELLNGDMTGLFFPTVILVSLALAYMLARADEDELFLHADHIERRKLSGRVNWQDVIAIRWPVDDDHPDIQLVTGNGLIEKAFNIDFSAVSEPDKMTLVRYLRLCSQNMEQGRWPDFCHRAAMPLLDNANALESILATPKLTTWNERFLACGCNMASSQPFLAGLTAPLTFVLFFLPLMISRLTAWTLALLIALSAFINIYLFWGEWLSPFTQIAGGVVVVFMTVGALSVRRPFESDRDGAKNPDAVSGVFAWLSLSVLVLGLPLYLNLVAWNMAPKLSATTLKLLLLGLLFGPLVYIIAIRRKRETARRAQSLAIWEKSESSTLP